MKMVVAKRNVTKEELKNDILHIFKYLVTDDYIGFPSIESHIDVEFFGFVVVIVIKIGDFTEGKMLYFDNGEWSPTKYNRDTDTYGYSPDALAISISHIFSKIYSKAMDTMLSKENI